MAPVSWAALPWVVAFLVFCISLSRDAKNRIPGLSVRTQLILAAMLMALLIDILWSSWSSP